MWQGRRLTRFSHIDGEQYAYTYNADGIRTSKQIRNADNAFISGVEYIYDGSKLVAESRNGEWMYYVYDETGAIAGLSYNNTLYFFRKNLQGDVTGIYNANGALVVEYTYSPYGEVLSVTGTMTNTIGTINPIRYRGYYYDTETGFYYLQSRYYDPTVGRFLNADVFVSTGQGIIGNNMFAYCLNNPIIRTDIYGEESGIWPWLLTKDLGYVHRLVQEDIVAKFPTLGLQTEVLNSAGYYMDIYCPSMGFVWEVKHNSSTSGLWDAFVCLYKYAGAVKDDKFVMPGPYHFEGYLYNLNYETSNHVVTYNVHYKTAMPGIILYDISIIDSKPKQEHVQEKSTAKSYSYNYSFATIKKYSKVLGTITVALVSAVMMCYGAPITIGG